MDELGGGWRSTEGDLAVVIDQCSLNNLWPKERGRLKGAEVSVVTTAKQVR